MYGSNGTTVVRSAANDFGVGNASPETISLAGVVAGTYYAVVTPHTAGFGIANYTLQITPPAATGDDPYEPNSDKATVDGDTAGATNSPNLGVLTATKTIQNLVMDDAADWFKFQTQGVGTTANSVTVSFDPNAGDMDLTLYGSNGTTVVRSAANDFGVGNASPETISFLAGVVAGTYYAVVLTHTAGFGIASYTLQITSPAATGDDPYEPNSDKVTVDGGTAGGQRTRRTSGVLTATKTIQNLVMADAADWFKFQTQGVGTTANSVTISFDPNAGDLDLVLYGSDGTTVVRSAANDFGVGDVSPETISLATIPAGTYYAVVTPHTAGFGIASYTLQIAPGVALTSIAVTPPNPAIAKAGVQQFTATGTFADGTTQNLTSQVTWTSATPAVATINKQRVATGVTSGTTAITAGLGGVVSPGDTLTVLPSALMSIAVTPSNPSIAKGLTEQFTATRNLHRQLDADHHDPGNLGVGDPGRRG